MVDLYFGDLAFGDIVMALATGLIASVILTSAYYLAASGIPDVLSSSQDPTGTPT